MGLEAATHISNLVATNPTGADDYATADDHIRLLKAVLQTQFPNFGTNAITPSAADLNIMLGAAAAGVTATELAFLDGVTSNIQAQLDAKAASGHGHVVADVSDFAAGVAANAAVAANTAKISYTDAAAVAANTAKVTNANHSGDASGSGVLTLLVAAITGKAALTSGLVATDELLVSDGGVLKRMDVSVMNAYFNSALSFAASSHNHNASEITAGTLPLARGGTNAASAAAAATSLGVGTGNSPQFAGVNVGHAADTTLSRGAAGKLEVEGKPIIAHNDGALGSGEVYFSTSDPSGGSAGDIWFKHEV